MQDRWPTTLSVCLIFAIAGIFGCVSAWTCDSPTNVTLTKSMLLDLKVRIWIKIGLNGTINDPDGQPYFPLVPGFVRLPFHVCAAKWCSSRIDLADPGNSGLQHAVKAADELHADIQLVPKYRGFSKADLYALCGVAALEFSTRFKNPVKFRYGRPDFCSFRDDPEKLGQLLPSTTMDTESTYAFMQRAFNFTQAETATIMGAHSIGVLRDGNGQPLWRWANKKADVLSNDYYKQLIDGRWHQVDRPVPGRREPFLQWIIDESPTKILLNTDLGLVRRLTSVPNDKSGRTLCTLAQACPMPLAPTWSTVSDYIRDENKFIKQFTNVFVKMIENGLSDKLLDIIA